MLTERLQAQAIANRLANLPDDTPLHHFTEPWRACWQALQNHNQVRNRKPYCKCWKAIRRRK